MSKSKILFKVTGSIACFKACAVISKLVQAGHEVQVVATKSALNFVGAATFEGLTGKKVASDMWAEGTMMDHIHMVRWADLIIVAPASANFLNQISKGIANDLVTTMFMAHDFKKPYLVFPAMNTSMYLHPLTQESVQKLKSIGIEVLDSASGVLACGENGIGRLLEADQILEELTSALKPKIKGKKILITSGGTQEPVDDVRVISNKSTGSTGAQIADTLIAKGCDVTFVHAQASQMPSQECKTIPYVSFSDLQSALTKEISENYYDTVIHAAAVSDFSVDNVQQGKISSNSEPVIHLKKNPKLVNQIKEISKNKNIQLIAFKMTSTTDPSEQVKAVDKIFQKSNAEIIVHNDMHEMNWGSEQHVFHIFKNKNDLNFIEDALNKSELAQKLSEVIL